MKISFIILWIGLINSPWAVATCTNQNANINLSKPDNVFNDEDDGTMTDLNTGLIWQKCSLGQAGGNSASSDCRGEASIFTWQEALDVTRERTSGSTFSSWRLPNKNELASLIETSCYSPAINQTVFTLTPTSDYWTSTPDMIDETRAWYVNFDNGEVSTINGIKNNKKHVRLVRVRLGVGLPE